jgi:hypothetical protein
MIVTLFVSLVKPNLEYAACVWFPYQVCHSKRVERFAEQSTHCQHMTRCALLGLDYLEDGLMMTGALFIRDLLCNRIDSAHLTGLLRKL